MHSHSSFKLVRWLMLALALGACESSSGGGAAGGAAGTSSNGGGPEGESQGSIFVAARQSVFEIDAQGAQVGSTLVLRDFSQSLDPDLFARDGRTIWAVGGGELLHVDMDAEEVIGRVVLPEEPAYAELVVSDDAVWLAGGTGTTWLTKIEKEPLALGETFTTTGWLNGIHVTDAGVDLLLSTTSRIVRVSLDGSEELSSVELRDKAGTSDWAVLDGEYWVGLRGSASAEGPRSARVRIADLALIETSDERVPWPPHREQYGFQHVIVTDGALFARDLDTGCVARVDRDDWSVRDDFHCVAEGDDPGDLRDVAAQGNSSVWVIDHVFGHFARIDATTGEERARNTALAGEALAP